MASLGTLMLTKAGSAMLAKIISGEISKPKFTKIVSSSHEYTEDELASLTDLEDKQQSIEPTEITVVNSTSVQVGGIFSNAKLTTGYNLKAIGLYMTPDGGDETLYAACIETTGSCFIPANNSVSETAITPYLLTTVGDSTNVSLEINPAGTVTVEQFKGHTNTAITSESGIHGMRYVDGQIQVSDGSVWNGATPAILNNAGSHNRFRGKKLGTSFTTDQAAAISAQTFKDEFLGDYWDDTAQSVKWRVADLNKFLHRGDTELTKPHLVIVPDAGPYNGQMHTTTSGGYEAGSANTTDGGYTATDMYKTGLAKIITMAQNFFGSDHVLSHRSLLDNACANGIQNGWAWYDVIAQLLTEEQVYGTREWSQYTQNGYGAGIDYDQFELFRQAPEFICNRQFWWLRSVRSASAFCGVGASGDAAHGTASYVLAVRPFFLIG